MPVKCLLYKDFTAFIMHKLLFQFSKYIRFANTCFIVNQCFSLQHTYVTYIRCNFKLITLSCSHRTGLSSSFKIRQTAANLSMEADKIMRCLIQNHVFGLYDRYYVTAKAVYAHDFMEKLCIYKQQKRGY